MSIHSTPSAAASAMPAAGLLAILTWLPLGASAPQRVPASIEDELRTSVLAQPIGAGTVDDLALPEAFVERVGGRIVRASFRERFHRVVADPAQPEQEGDEPLPGWVWAASYAALALVLAGWMARAAARRTS